MVPRTIVVSGVIILLAHAALAQPRDSKLLVVTTIPPLAALVKAVGGESVEVRYLVPCTSDPHQYAPRPEDMELASKCDLFVEVGKEPFLETLPGERGRVRITWSDWVSSGLSIEAGNPHYIWLYPPNAVKAAYLIAKRLAKLDPAGAALYVARANAFAEEVQHLEEWGRGYVSVHGVGGATVVAVGSHFIPLLKYFGFRVIGPLTVSEGQAPSPSDTAKLIEDARRAGAKVVVVLASQRNSDEGRIGRAIASELGVNVVYLHGIQFSGEDDYVEYIKYTLTALVAALEASHHEGEGNSSYWPALVSALGLLALVEAVLLVRGWGRGGA